MNTTNNNIEFPSISLELLEYLRFSFPNTLPIEEVSSFELGKLVGIQNLINHIVMIRDSK